jgi:hypothetical protein
MAVTTPEPDDFERFCESNNFTSEEERARAFPIWVADTTGWDGNNFSLTEAERHWIKNAQELIEWLSTYRLTGQPEALAAALLCLANMPPFPGSLSGN